MLVVNPLWGSSTAEPGLTTSNLLSKATMHCPSIPSCRISTPVLVLSPGHLLLLVPPMHLPKEDTPHAGHHPKFARAAYCNKRTRIRTSTIMIRAAIATLPSWNALRRSYLKPLLFLLRLIVSFSAPWR